MKTGTSVCFLVLLCLHLGSCSSPTKCSLDGMFEHIVSDVLSRQNCGGGGGHNGKGGGGIGGGNDDHGGTGEGGGELGHKIVGDGHCQIKDCADIALSGHKMSGVYKVWPRGWEDCGMKVYCDLEHDGGGWTVIQRRGQFGNAKDMFYQKWHQYKIGFGNLYKEFWLGNDKIHYLVEQDEYELKIDMKTKDGEKKYAHYDEFYIGAAHDKYKLSVRKYRGDAGDSLSVHNGMNFATFDHDRGTCAHTYKGAWWYNGCHNSNLNGMNYDGPHSTYADGINWGGFKGYYNSLTSTIMKVRPASYGDRTSDKGHSFAPTPPPAEEDHPTTPGPQAGPDHHEDPHTDDHHEDKHTDDHHKDPHADDHHDDKHTDDHHKDAHADDHHKDAHADDHHDDAHKDDHHNDAHKDDHHNDAHKDDHHDDAHKDDHHDDAHKDDHHNDAHKDDHHDDAHKDDHHNDAHKDDHHDDAHKDDHHDDAHANDHHNEEHHA